MTGLLDHLPQVDTGAPLLYWLLGSVLVYVLCANLLWLFRSRDLGRRVLLRWLGETVLFLYFLGIPYLVLGGWPRPPFSALLLPEEMGLVGWNPPWPADRWLQSAGDGMGAGLVIFLFLTFAWRSANRRSEEGRLPFPRRPGWLVLRDSLYLQVHWGFYRGAVAVLLGDLYAGVFVGLGLAYLEWGLDPFWKRGWRYRNEAGLRWLQAALALVAAMLYFLTRNLWVCLCVHGLIALGFWALGTPVTPEPGHARPDDEEAIAGGLADGSAASAS